MRRLLIYGLTLTIGLLPALAKAQTEVTMEPKLLSLQEAMDYAVKHSASAKNARLDVLMQQRKNAEITGVALPQLNVEGQFSAFLNPQKSFLPGEFFQDSTGPMYPPGTFVPVQFTPKYSSSATGSISQILFDGSILVALQARTAAMKLYEQSARLSEEEIRYTVQKAYYAFIIARRQYGILNSSLAYARNMGNDIEVLYQNGFAEKIDVDRTNVQINNLATDSMRIGSMLTLSEQLLKYQMGMEISQPIILTDTSVDAKIMEASEMLLSTEADYDDRTEFGILQTQLLLNKYDLKRHRLSGLPSLAAFGSLNYNYASNEFSDLVNKPYLNYSLVGLKLNIKIFDGLQRYNRVKQAKLSIEKTKNSIENLKLGIDLQTAQSKTSLKNALLTMKSQERNLGLANGVLDLARKKYKAGVGSNTEVTQAQTEMLQSQNNYFNAMLDVINAKSDLQKAIGQFK
ncbi:MAG TPA: TolC family protein [Flavipsychrobacter sp.]